VKKSPGNTFTIVCTWSVFVLSGKLCPDGWHIPTDDEWKALEILIGMSHTDVPGIDLHGTDQGLLLKSTTGWLEYGNGCNTCKFSGLPGGMRLPLGSFRDAGTIGQWWSSPKDARFDYFWSRSLLYNSPGLSRTLLSMQFGCSIRCIKDKIRSIQ
jgi:uncharacterized protein (TIGR02145 family)